MRSSCNIRAGDIWGNPWGVGRLSPAPGCDTRPACRTCITLLMLFHGALEGIHPCLCCLGMEQMLLGQGLEEVREAGNEAQAGMGEEGQAVGAL